MAHSYRWRLPWNAVWVLLLMMCWCGAESILADETVFRRGDQYLVIFDDGSILGFSDFREDELASDCGRRKTVEWDLPKGLARTLERYRAIALPFEEPTDRLVHAVHPPMGHNSVVSAGFADWPDLEDLVSEVDYCDITVHAHTAMAQSCAPDCHGDCDEGHDGTTCHAHSFFPQWSYGVKASWIDDLVDCCICEPFDGTECGVGTVPPDECGTCASAPGGLLCFDIRKPWDIGSRSCCSNAQPDDVVKRRGRTNQRSYPARFVTIHPGDSGLLDNRVLVKQGGKENCSGGSEDGWHYGADAFDWQPDRSIETHLNGSYAFYDWTGASPVIYGDGRSFYCGTLPSCDPSSPFCFE